MDTNSVTTLLKELRNELERTESLRERDREHLERLVDEIQALLTHSAGTLRPADDSTIDRLRDTTGRFEVSHPQLTAILGRVIDALSNMGI